MNTRSFIFFTRILVRAQISSLIFRELFYWGFISHNFGDYKNLCKMQFCWLGVLSVTILETTKTDIQEHFYDQLFYRSQFWRLQKPLLSFFYLPQCFIGHNFGDYKNRQTFCLSWGYVLSVTILETTKTKTHFRDPDYQFYRSQFWRLQKLSKKSTFSAFCFIGHNFGDYKNWLEISMKMVIVLSVTILETTKTKVRQEPFCPQVLSVTILETTKTGWKYQWKW